MTHTTSVIKQIELSNEMKYRDRAFVPLFMVRAMFALMFVSLALVAYAVVKDVPLRGVSDKSAIVSEALVVLDGNRSDGVAVIDESGAVIAHSTNDKAGFIDVIWNSITRVRLVQDIPSDAPLRVVRRANGHTAIFDPTTGWSIELIGYGKDNVAAFARLLD